MTQYGPGARRVQHPAPARPELDALIEKQRPKPAPTIIGLAGDGCKITLWLQTTSEPPLTMKKEMGYVEAIDLARRLLNEASAIR